MVHNHITMPGTLVNNLLASIRDKAQRGAVFQKVYGATLVTLLSFMLSALPAIGQQPKETKHVLILITGQNDVPGFIYSEEGMREILDQSEDFQFEYFIEYMDSYRFNDASYKKDLFDLYQTKYTSKKIDLVIAHGYQALEFAANQGKDIFPHTPVVFSAVLETQLKRLNLDENYTGSLMEIDYHRIFKTALKIHPDTRHIGIISGTSNPGRFIEKQSRDFFAPYEDKYDFIYLGHLPMKDILAKVSNFPEDTIIIYYYMALDGNGTAIKPWQAAGIISDAANVPVYGMADTYLGQGIIGGALLSWREYGKKAGELGLRILNGEKPADLPISSEGTTLNMFDWRQLQRWGITESKLPADSIVQYKRISAWEAYNWYIVGVLFFVILQIIIIFFLLASRKKLRGNESLLRASNDRFRAFMDNSIEGIWCASFDEPISLNLSEEDQFELVYKHGYISEANDAYASSVGFSLGKELIGTRLEEFVPRSNPTNVASVKNWIRNRYSIRNAETIESYKDGVTRNILNNAVAVIKAGHLERVWGTQIDITERKLAEEQLRYQGTLLENVSDAVVSVDTDFKVVSWNQAAEKIYGWKAEEVQGKLINEFTSINYIGNSRDAVLSNLERDGFWRGEILQTRKDGEQISVQATYSVLKDRSGETSGIVGVSRDITDLRKAEGKMREQRDLLSHMDRVSSLGVLTGGISHEINQPLSAILSNAQAALRFMKNDPQDLGEVQEALHDIVSDSKRCGEIVHSIRNIMGRQVSKREEIDLNKTVNDVLTLIKNDALSKGISISENLRPNIPPIHGHRTQIQQLTLNLLMNAMEALQGNYSKNPEINVATGINDNKDIILCVSDSGPGIEHDQINTIFKSFTTSKKKGLGIGLTICTSIAENHEGRLWGGNRPEGGAIFCLTLPTGMKSND